MAVAENPVPAPQIDPKDIPGDYRIVVDSIGSSNAKLIKILRTISPMSEKFLAQKLYQAPSVLIDDISEAVATHLNEVLQTSGLKSHVAHRDEAFEEGKPEYEVALVVKDMASMNAAALEIIQILGVGVEDAKKILLSSPTILLGNISANTVEALAERFKKIGVEIDVTQPQNALYDLFMGDCSDTDFQWISNLLEKAGVSATQANDDSRSKALISTGLSKERADEVWEKIRRSTLPIKLVNRNFERFDLRLDEVPSSPELSKYLMETTGMPEKIAKKIPEKTPIVLYQNIGFQDLDRHATHLAQLGATTSGHLLVFQTFSLDITKVKDLRKTNQIIASLTKYSLTDVEKMLTKGGRIEGPLTNPQSRWLQYELKLIGTESKRVLR